MDEQKDYIDNTLKSTFRSAFRQDVDSHDDIIDGVFDGYEAMLQSEVYDSVSKTTKSKITDGASATIIIERSARVVGQLPTGVMKAAGKKDAGKAALMDIIRQKYIYPNANSQMPFLNKLRSWELYSSVYGYMPMYYDWNVAPNGYVGPDCWLWNPRNFVPQKGRNSISDMDYVHAIVYVGKSYLEGLLEDDDSWNKEAIREVLEYKRDTEENEQDAVRETFSRKQQINGGTDEIMLVTRYEAGKAGKWVTFAPEHGFAVLREIDNPHKSAKIPFVIKPCIPQYDSFYDLGDFKRFKPIQFAKDGLLNFYFEGIKTNIKPPIIINANGVIQHTISNDPNAVLQETIPNSIRRMETSTAGLASYQAASSQMQGMLLNAAGTTDTAVNADAALDPGFGKTPEALKMHQARESTRDNLNRAYLESALEELMDGMLALIPAIGSTSMPIELFREEIDMLINEGLEDVTEMIKFNESKNQGKITIDPKALGGVEYKFYLDSGSTVRSDKNQKKQDIMELLNAIKSVNNLEASMAQQGEAIDWKQIFTDYGSTVDIDMSKYIKKAPPQVQGGINGEQSLGSVGPQPGTTPATGV